MDKTTFIYTTYILSTPERVWEALTVGDVIRRYWGGRVNVSDWRPGSPWEHRDPERPDHAFKVGTVLEAEPPRRLVLTWANPAQAADPDHQSRVTLDITPVDDMVRLTVTHEDLPAGSAEAASISAGWPLVLSSLKSLLETGRPIPIRIQGTCA